MGKDILAGKLSLADLAAKVDADGINPQPKSGQQEYLENLINRFV
jgi:xylose isomerase